MVDDDASVDSVIRPAEVAHLGTILSVWAHPDDEAYLCGGLMALAVAAGSRVVCVTATKGELGVTDPARWPPEQLAEIRTAEMAESLRALGVTEHRWLGYPDGGCAAVPVAEGAARIAEVLRDVRPDAVLTFAPDGQTGHPDHIAIHHWVAAAVSDTGLGDLHVVANPPAWVEAHLAKFLEWGVIVGEPPAAWTGPLSVDLTLSGDPHERKLAALRAQASQTEAFRALAGDEFYGRFTSTEAFRRWSTDAVVTGQ